MIIFFEIMSVLCKKKLQRIKNTHKSHSQSYSHNNLHSPLQNIIT